MGATLSIPGVLPRPAGASSSHSGAEAKAAAEHSRRKGQLAREWRAERGRVKLSIELLQLMSWELILAKANRFTEAETVKQEVDTRK